MENKGGTQGAWVQTFCTYNVQVLYIVPAVAFKALPDYQAFWQAKLQLFQTVQKPVWPFLPPAQSYWPMRLLITVMDQYKWRIAGQ